MFQSFLAVHTALCLPSRIVCDGCAAVLTVAVSELASIIRIALLLFLIIGHLGDPAAMLGSSIV
jgi:hypothetical protein